MTFKTTIEEDEEVNDKIMKRILSESWLRY